MAVETLRSFLSTSGSLNLHKNSSGSRVWKEQQLRYLDLVRKEGRRWRNVESWWLSVVGPGAPCRKVRVVAARDQEAFCHGLLPLKVTYGKMLSEVSSWGIGGPAKMFVEVTSPREMASVLRYCTSKEINWFVVGKGSNCLFDDRGFDGCIILNRIDFMESLGRGMFHVGSGYAFNTLGVHCSRSGFSGLEFAAGIPGTVGGAIYMNAGADGQETGDIVHEVEIVTTDGVSRTLLRDLGELDFFYRTSPFQKLKNVAAIVAATFKLVPDPNAKERQRLYLERRKRTQPISERSAGCVFRNPGAGCQSAGALIEQSGLKGVAIGAARVSEKHGNFLVNSGGSNSHDMQTLIALVKDQVHKKFGVQLHEEILFIPFNDDVQPLHP